MSESAFLDQEVKTGEEPGVSTLKATFHSVPPSSHSIRLSSVPDLWSASATWIAPVTWSTALWSIPVHQRTVSTPFLTWISHVFSFYCPLFSPSLTSWPLFPVLTCCLFESQASVERIRHSGKNLGSAVHLPEWAPSFTLTSCVTLVINLNLSGPQFTYL